MLGIVIGTLQYLGANQQVRAATVYNFVGDLNNVSGHSAKSSEYRLGAQTCGFRSATKYRSNAVDL